jgi:hypothetical protein
MATSFVEVVTHWRFDFVGVKEHTTDTKSHVACCFGVNPLLKVRAAASSRQGFFVRTRKQNGLQAHPPFYQSRDGQLFFHLERGPKA